MKEIRMEIRKNKVLSESSCFIRFPSPRTRTLLSDAIYQNAFALLASLVLQISTRRQGSTGNLPLQQL